MGLDAGFFMTRQLDFLAECNMKLCVPELQTLTRNFSQNIWKVVFVIAIKEMVKCIRCLEWRLKSFNVIFKLQWAKYYFIHNGHFILLMLLWLLHSTAVASHRIVVIKQWSQFKSFLRVSQGWIGWEIDTIFQKPTKKGLLLLMHQFQNEMKL